jgi:hypothetical protein
MRRIGAASILLLTGAVAVAVLFSGAPRGPTVEDFFADLRAREEAASRVFTERSFADLIPAADQSAELVPPISEGLVIGAVVEVQPGRGYVVEGADAPSGTEVEFENADALWRTVAVTLDVERAFGPRLSGLGQIRFGLPISGEQDPQAVIQQLSALGRVVVVLDPQGRFVYDRELYGVHWDGVFLGVVHSDDSFEFPALGEYFDDFMGGVDSIAEIEAIHLDD